MEERKSRFTTPYTRQAIEWILVVGLAGIIASILGIASAVVYRAWTA